MTIVTIHQAKTHLSKLIAQAEAGGEVVIARGKTPVAKLLAADPPLPPVDREPGRWKGRPGFGFDDRFFDPLPDDELALWNGEGD